MGSTDQVNQDNFEHGRAFVGQASGEQWMRKLRRELKGGDPGPQYRSHYDSPSSLPSMGEGISTQNPSPYYEDMDTSIVGHQIDPFSLPLKSTADALVRSYFSTVHVSFPMINKADFLYHYRQVSSANDLAAYPDRTFLSILHFVFAIGAVHAHLIEAEWAGDSRDHMLYFAQARMQAVETGVLNDICYLGQVQVFGLGSMYLLATDQINRYAHRLAYLRFIDGDDRAWNLNGLTIRAAQSLGLHLRDATTSISPTERMLRAQIWYSITSLESMLTVITGRPTMVNDRDCTVPLLHALSEEAIPETSNTSPSDMSATLSAMEFSTHRSPSATSESKRSSLKLRMLQQSKTPVESTYFMHYTELCALAKKIVGDLYRPEIRQYKWSEIQMKMDDYNKQLQRWRESLYPPFNVATKSADTETESCRAALLILFYSTSTIINRPCLCRLKERIPERSSSSKEKNRNFANNCIKSARSVLDLILNEPEATILHQGVTWWMLLHHLKRALTIVLLELAFRAEHMPADAASILSQAKRAVAWLRWLGNSSPTARRTWVSMSELLYSAAQKVGGDTSDIAIATDTFPDGVHDNSGEHRYQQPAQYDMAYHHVFEPQGLYGGGEGQNFGDLAARSELDQFGFNSWQLPDEQMQFGENDLYYDPAMLGRGGTGGSSGFQN